MCIRLTLLAVFVKTRLMRDRHVRWAILIGLAAIAVRFIAINQPFVDEWSWRQSDVAAIARNYFTGGFHFARPQIDWAGNEPGYVGTEFPVLPFAAACSYNLFGIHEWLGRIQALIFFAVSLPFLFWLARETLGPAAATWTIFFHGFAPLSVMASRCFIPDMPSLSLSIIGLYLFLRWAESNRWTCFAAAAFCISLSILIKAPSAIVGAPLAWIAFRRFGTAGLRQVRLWLFGVIALAPAALWYWHAYQISLEFYPHHFFGAGGFRIESLAFYGRILSRLVTESLTPILLALAAVGFVMARKNKPLRGLWSVWLGAMLVFVVVVGYGNRHPWYQLPLVPIGAVLAGVATARFRVGGQALLAAGFLVLSFFCVRPRYRASSGELREAGLELKRTTATGSLIVAADYGDPSIFYYAERKGWHFTEREAIYNAHPLDSADAIADLERLRARGATQLVFYSGSFWWLNYYHDFADHLSRTAILREDNPRFRIYDLKTP